MHAVSYIKIKSNLLLARLKKKYFYLFIVDKQDPLLLKKNIFQRHPAQNTPFDLILNFIHLIVIFHSSSYFLIFWMSKPNNILQNSKEMSLKLCLMA